MALGLGFFVPAAEDVVGLVQRLAEATFYGWLVFIAIAATGRQALREA